MIKDHFLQLSAVILLCLIVIPNTYSQSPGYLGKKLSIGVGSSFHVAYYGPTKNNKSVVESRFAERAIALNSTLELTADYALWRYGSLGVYGSQYKTGLRAFYDDFGVGTRLNVFHILNVNTVGLRFSRFKASRGALAPIGRYVSYGLEGVFVDGMTDSIKIDGLPITGEILDFEQKTSFLNLSVKYMMSYPLSDKLLLKVGGSLRVPLLKPDTFIGVLDVDDTFYGDDPSFENYFKFLAIERVIRHGMTRFELNLSYLLF